MTTTDRADPQALLRLDEKAVIVTGAGSGLGAASATLAAELGARLLLVDRDGAALSRQAQILDAVGFESDVADVSANERLVEACIRHFGRIDGLVNAAGVMQTAPFLDITVADYDRIFSVNMRGAFFLQQAAAREMATRGGGSIVNFSSTAGRVGRPLASHYAAAKAGILTLTRSVAVGLAPMGVRVNAVCPGLIETPMIDRITRERAELLGTTPQAVVERWRETIPMGRLGTPEEVAFIVCFLLSDASSYVTGEHIGATGGTDGS